MIPMLERGRARTAGPDEPTVRIARKDFRRRRFAGRRRRILLVLLLVTAVSAATWLVFFSPYVTAQEVRISGNDRVGRPRIERAARVPTGTPLARVDLASVTARVESIPAVRQARVSRSWPHAVHIAVEERVPVAVVDRGAGLQALDRSGVLFGRYQSRPEGLALVRVDEDAHGDALVEAGRVLHSLPQSVARRVETVQVSSVDQIRFGLRGGKRVVWGSAEDSEEKSQVVEALLERPGTEIDVSVPGRPTTR
ncbi:MAG TPA: FtsQ-type POTRA domain-containing protein [Marmoricola sp.]|nr:FtsQ-type POTRA domain-containing protein [Marmoricola sp.]